MLCESCNARIREVDYPPEVDPELRLVNIPAHTRHIRPMEFDLLGVLWRRQGQVVSRDTLTNLLWGMRFPEDDRNNVRVHVAKLRRTFAGLPYTISNVYGGGYCMRRAG